MNWFKKLLGAGKKTETDVKASLQPKATSSDTEPEGRPAATKEETAKLATPLRTVARTGDAYVDDCFHIELQEFDEGRDWYKMPEAKAISDVGNAGRIEEALHLAEGLRDKCPDFHFPYYWVAELYRRQGRYDDARNSLIAGLRLAKSKYDLCWKMGEMEWQLGNLPESVKWWIKSAVLQVSAGKLDTYVAWQSFLYLSYVAEALGLGSACSRLRQYTDKIRLGQIRLNADPANKLHTAARRQGPGSMKQAIDLLDREYVS